MKGSSIKNAIYLISGLIVVDLSFISFVLGVYKDYPKNIFSNDYFQIGTLIILFSLPVVATFAYSLFRINPQTERTSKETNVINILLVLGFIVSMLNIVGIYCFLDPFIVKIGEAYIGYNCVFVMGIIVSIIVLFLFNAMLIKK